MYFLVSYYKTLHKKNKIAFLIANKINVSVFQKAQLVQG
jgi:hypothetical protein